MSAFLESKEDMDWLSEVHIPGANQYACAALEGNEDCPSEVRLFARNHVRCKPTIYKADENGNLVLSQFGHKPKS